MTVDGDGQDLGQEAPPAEGGEAGSEGGFDSGGEPGEGGGEPDRLGNLEAQLGLLANGLAEVRDSLLSSAQGRQVAEDHGIDLESDEPLTARQVNALMRQNLNQVAAQTDVKAEQRSWDQKAQADFPFKDPKFKLQFEREWKEQVQSGIVNSNHPKAVYHVAQAAARTLGTKKTSARKSSSTVDTSEPASTGVPPSQRRAAANAKGSEISDSDPRVSFYNMKGNKSDQQIAAFKERLAEQDRRKERRA